MAPVRVSWPSGARHQETWPSSVPGWFSGSTPPRRRGTGHSVSFGHVCNIVTRVITVLMIVAWDTQYTLRSHSI